jgi:lipopolysaccharide transport system permease protein
MAASGDRSAGEYARLRRFAMAVDITAPVDEQAPAPPHRAPVELPYTHLTLSQSAREAWRSRHVLWLFSLFAIKRMFFLTMLGPGWILVNVLMDIGGKTFLFGSVLNVKTPDGVPYIIFLLTGLLGWTLFQQTLTFGTRSLQRYRKWTEHLYFPLLIVPIAAGAQALLHFLIYFWIVIAGLAYYAARGQVYYETGPQVLFVPLGLMLCLLFSWGLSFLLAPLNYRKRDVRLVLKYVMQFWLYVTPVVYPLQNLHGVVLWIAKLNPLAPMLEMIKYGLIGGGNIGIHFALWGAGWAVSTFVIGLLVLNRYGPWAIAQPLIDLEDDEDDL